MSWCISKIYTPKKKMLLIYFLIEIVPFLGTFVHFFGGVQSWSLHPGFHKVVKIYGGWASKKSPNWNPENHLNQTCMTLGSMLHPRKTNMSPKKGGSVSVGVIHLPSIDFQGTFVSFRGCNFQRCIACWFHLVRLLWLDWCAPGIGLVVGTSYAYLVIFFTSTKNGVRNASKRYEHWT